MYIQRKIAARSCNHCCSGKTVIFWVCVFSLRYPVCEAHAPYCHLWSVWLYNFFSTLSHKRHDFAKTIWNIKCVLRFSLKLLSETFLILRIQQAMYIGLHVKYPLFLSDVNETSIYSKKFRKMLKFVISWKSVQWEPNCSIRTDWQTDGRTHRHDEANSHFSLYCEGA
jgi:hypothetical protein